MLNSKAYLLHADFIAIMIKYFFKNILPKSIFVIIHVIDNKSGLIH